MMPEAWVHRIREVEPPINYRNLILLANQLTDRCGIDEIPIIQAPRPWGPFYPEPDSYHTEFLFDLLSEWELGEPKNFDPNGTFSQDEMPIILAGTCRKTGATDSAFSQDIFQTARDLWRLYHFHLRDSNSIGILDDILNPVVTGISLIDLIDKIGFAPDLSQAFEIHRLSRRLKTQLAVLDRLDIRQRFFARFGRPGGENREERQLLLFTELFEGKLSSAKSFAWMQQKLYSTSGPSEEKARAVIEKTHQLEINFQEKYLPARVIPPLDFKETSSF